MTAPGPVYVKVSKAQEVFGLHPSTIYRMADRGEITIHKSGGSSLIRVEEMIKHVEGSAQ